MISKHQFNAIISLTDSTLGYMRAYLQLFIENYRSSDSVFVRERHARRRITLAHSTMVVLKGVCWIKGYCYKYCAYSTTHDDSDDFQLYYLCTLLSSPSSNANRTTNRPSLNP